MRCQFVLLPDSKACLMHLNINNLCLTPLTLRGYGVTSPPPRFAAEKWVMRDDDPPVGRGALSRGFCEVGVWLVLFNLKKSEF